MSLVCQKCGCRHDPHGACVDPLDNAYVIGRDGRRIPWVFGNDAPTPSRDAHKAGASTAQAVPGAVEAAGIGPRYHHTDSGAA